MPALGYSPVQPATSGAVWDRQMGSEREAESGILSRESCQLWGVGVQKKVDEQRLGVGAGVTGLTGRQSHAVILQTNDPANARIVLSVQWTAVE